MSVLPFLLWLGVIYGSRLTHNKLTFVSISIHENAGELLNTLVRLKPTASKGTYMKNISLSSTMSPGINIDPKSI